MVGDWISAGVESGVAGGCVQVEQFLAAVMCVFLDFEGAVRVTSFAGREVQGRRFKDFGVHVMTGKRLVWL